MGCCCTDTRVRGAIAKANTNRLKTASPGQRNAALTTWLLKSLQVVVEIVPLQVQTPITPVIASCEEQGCVSCRVCRNQQGVADRPAGIVDQSRGCRPLGIVEHGAMQRHEDAVEGVVLAHEILSSCGIFCFIPPVMARFGEE